MQRAVGSFLNDEMGAPHSQMYLANGFGLPDYPHNYIEPGKRPQCISEAIEYPCIHHQWLLNIVRYEADLSKDYLDALKV